MLFALATVVYVYGGRPFLSGFLSELRNREPGMMTLIDVMLLGHWLEMRSVMGASRALEELVRLLPDTALKLDAQGNMQEVPVNALQPGDPACPK